MVCLEMCGRLLHFEGHLPLSFATVVAAALQC